MRTSSFIPLLCTCLTYTVAAAPLVIPRLPIEAHSFNDIDLWPQLLRKGVRWMKLDISYCTLESCTSYSTFNTAKSKGSMNDCFLASDNNTYCCMCMRGDASTRPYMLFPFNTTRDLIDFFNDSSRIAAGYIPTTGSDHSLMMGLDFGGVQLDLMNSTENALFVKFLTDWHSVILAHNLSIIPYFDAGASEWFQAIDMECFSTGCSGWAKELQQLPWPSEDGDSLPPTTQDPYNRYSILNSDVSDLEGDCNASVWNASLSKADGYPYLWYEPSSQIEYLGFFDFWKSCPTVPTDKKDPNLGVVVVSNQATEMFETYASSAIGRGMNTLLVEGLALPLLAVLPASAASGYNRVLAVSGSNTTSGPQLLLLGMVDDQSQPAMLRALPLAGTLVDMIEATDQIINQTMLVTLDNEGRVQVSTWNVSSMVLTPTTLFTAPQGSVALDIVCDNTCALFILVSNSSGIALYSASLNGTIGLSGILLQSAQVISADLVCISEESDSSVTCLILYSAGLAEPASHANLVDGAIADSLNAACAHPGEAQRGDTRSCNKTILHDSWRHNRQVPKSGQSAKAELYGIIAEISMQFQSTWIIQSITQSNRLGFGAQPSLSKAMQSGSAVLLEMHTHGSCQCGLLMNNDDTPHCLIPDNSSDNDPLLSTYQSVPYLLNYNYGKWDAFARLIAGNYTAAIDSYFGMCHSEIMSGKFECGASVSGALYQRNVIFANSTEAPNGIDMQEIAVLAVHDGDVLCPIVTTVVCGSPLPKAGLVLDQFRVVQPDDLP